MQASPVRRVCALVENHQREGFSLSRIARLYGVQNIGFLAYQVKRGDAYIRPDLYRAMLGETWHTTKVLWRGPAVNAPHVLAQHPPRQCPVTGTWFIPTQSTQKYLPGLSPAVKRAYRRNPDAARVKFGERGDWGQRSGLKKN